MAIDDTWFSSRRRGPDGKKLPAKKHGRGKRWRVRYEDPNTGKGREELFAKLDDAKLFDANMQADISRGRYVDPKAGRVTVKALAEEWLSGLVCDDATLERMRRAFRLHVYPDLGDLPIGTLKTARLQQWVKARSEHLAPSTLRIVTGYVSTMCRDAVTDQTIGRNPCTGLKLPELTDAEMWIPSAEQVRALSNELRPELAAVPIIAAGCGLRPSEVFALELGHVNHLRRELHVRQQVKYLKQHGIYLDHPKTKTSKRTVDLPDYVGETIARHIEKYGTTTRDMLDLSEPRKPVTRSVEMLFTAPGGGPLYRGTWSASWVAAVAAVEDVPEGTGLHALRHFYASALIANGAHVKRVQKLMGHSTPTVTLDTYVHLWPDEVDETRTAMDRALRPESGPNRAQTSSVTANELR